MACIMIRIAVSGQMVQLTGSVAIGVNVTPTASISPRATTTISLR
jgi:hypothetical protein